MQCFHFGSVEIIATDNSQKRLEIAISMPPIFYEFIDIRPKHR